MQFCGLLEKTINMKNKVCFFTPASSDREDEFVQMSNSLKKFHPDVPLFRWNDDKIKAYQDQHFFYRATPIIAKELFRDYDYVVKMDSDTIVTGDLSELWNGDFDVAVVNNSNPREFKAYNYQILDIHPYAYVNCGLVSMHSERFINHWLNLCFSEHFASYQMREQDLLNIMVHYGDYKVKKMDEGDSFYGLASKGYWSEIELKDDKLFLAKGEEGWPDKDKWIKAIHFAGGNIPNKMNLHTKFQPEIVKVLKGYQNE